MPLDLGLIGRCAVQFGHFIVGKGIDAQLVVARSATSGNWPDAVWNILILLLAFGPMWAPAQFKTQSAGDVASAFLETL